MAQGASKRHPVFTKLRRRVAQTFSILPLHVVCNPPFCSRRRRTKISELKSPGWRVSVLMKYLVSCETRNLKHVEVGLVWEIPPLLIGLFRMVITNVLGAKRTSGSRHRMMGKFEQCPGVYYCVSVKDPFTNHAPSNHSSVDTYHCSDGDLFTELDRGKPMLSHKTLDLLTNTTSLQPSTVATSSSSCSSST